jgi:hypothetical protein
MATCNVDWKENSQSYFHTLQALDVSPMCDAADGESIIHLFPHSSHHDTDNSSHSLSDAPLQIIDIRTLRDFLSICTQDMDLESVVFVKYIFESVCFFLNNPVLLYLFRCSLFCMNIGIVGFTPIFDCNLIHLISSIFPLLKSKYLNAWQVVGGLHFGDEQKARKSGRNSVRRQSHPHNLNTRIVCIFILRCRYRWTDTDR